VAAFDFDGTLIAGDSFLPFLARAMGRQALTRAAVVAGPTLVRGNRDITKAAVLAYLMRGYPLAQLAAQVRPTMSQRLAWHRTQGHRLVMVSASLDIYLAPVGRQLGFDCVLATQLEVDDRGLLTGKLRGANVRRAEKATRLRQWLEGAVAGRPYELWAYGDSTGDRELLAMADHPVRV
jgi:HAD superfamily phosphoserine phosphatase-like hydrolase